MNCAGALPVELDPGEAVENLEDGAWAGADESEGGAGSDESEGGAGLDESELDSVNIKHKNSENGQRALTVSLVIAQEADLTLIVVG